MSAAMRHVQLGTLRALGSPDTQGLNHSLQDMLAAIVALLTQVSDPQQER